MTRGCPWLVAWSSVALLAAVGVSSCGDEVVKGVTPCGTRGGVSQECQPGEYCVDPDTGSCDTGCLSDQNCGEGEQCARPYGLLVPGYCARDYDLDDDDL